MLAGCFGIAHQRAMTPSNIISGFKKCGIFPYDRDTFTDSDFLVSSVTERLVPSDMTNQIDHNNLLNFENCTNEPSCSGVASSVFLGPENFRGY